jgi:hypothetical protein
MLITNEYKALDFWIQYTARYHLVSIKGGLSLIENTGGSGFILGHDVRMFKTITDKLKRVCTDRDLRILGGVDVKANSGSRTARWHKEQRIKTRALTELRESIEMQRIYKEENEG